tara:strand:+ start:631 stop:804 length:174 start_codon:yes stop_codon:yes gene_type:complete
MWSLLKLVIGVLDLSDSKEKPSLRRILFKIMKWVLAFTLIIIIIGMAIGAWISENYL